jgi:hypothetical protein
VPIRHGAGNLDRRLRQVQVLRATSATDRPVVQTISAYLSLFMITNAADLRAGVLSAAELNSPLGTPQSPRTLVATLGSAMSPVSSPPAQHDLKSGSRFSKNAFAPSRDSRERKASDCPSASASMA